MIGRAAPPTGPQAAIIAQLAEDCALVSLGPDGAITEAEGAQLNDTVRSLGGIINAAHGRMVLAMCRVIQTGWWDGGGILSAKHWLSLHHATTAANITRVIAVAKRAEAYPEVLDALVAGEVTLEAAELICRRVPPEFQSAFVAYARNMTMSQLRTCTQAVPAPSNSPAKPDDDASPDDTSTKEGDEPVADDPPSQVSFGGRDGGRWALNANLSAEQGALLETALQDARDRAFASAEDPDEKVRLSWADALIDLARRSLDRSDADNADHRPTDRTLVHFHYEFGRLYLEGSDQPLPDALARQILCDTDLVGIGFRNGRPVDLGRKTRVIPARLRRIVLRRDGGCVVPGCGATRGLEIHHRIHWQDGGRTDSSNLIALCKAHHRAHHHGLLNIAGDPYSGLTFTNAAHVPIRARRPIVPADTSPHGLADNARTDGMADQPDHRFGPVGGSLHRWSILPGPVEVRPRAPDLSPITPGLSPTRSPTPTPNPTQARPALVRRE